MTGVQTCALPISTGEIDAAGHLVTPPFVDSHFHMDAALSLGLPRFNESGTLLEGIALWGELAPTLTPEAIKSRAHELCRWSIARGIGAIRSHVDVTDPSLMAVEVLLEVKREMAPWLVDRKSTRLNSSHGVISYAGSCLKKKHASTA